MSAPPDLSTIVSDSRMYGCRDCGAEIVGGQCTNPAHPVVPSRGRDHRARREGLGLEPTALDRMIESDGPDAALVDDEARVVAMFRLLDELVVFVEQHGFPETVAGWADNVVREACRVARERASAEREAA